MYCLKRRERSFRRSLSAQNARRDNAGQSAWRVEAKVGNGAQVARRKSGRGLKLQFASEIFGSCIDASSSVCVAASTFPYISLIEHSPCAWQVIRFKESRHSTMALLVRSKRATSPHSESLCDSVLQCIFAHWIYSQDFSSTSRRQSEQRVAMWTSLLA